jgi:LAO/AO transport system kinase
MIPPSELLERVRARDPRAIGRAISMVENGTDGARALLGALDEAGEGPANILGITGPPGSGKSTLTNQLIAHYRSAGQRVGVIAVDPSSPVHQGALLGDRVRMMQHATDPEVVMRSMAARSKVGGLSFAARAAAQILDCAGCQTILIETVGVGQTEMDVARTADLTVLVLAPGLGDDIQAMKAGLIELADILVINKSDRPGADLLLAEMEMLAHDTGQHVCLACALEGKGIDTLAAAADRLFQQHRDDGTRDEQRRAARDAEVLDRATEQARQHLVSLMRHPSVQAGHRFQRADRLLQELCKRIEHGHQHE